MPSNMNDSRNSSIPAYSLALPAAIREAISSAVFRIFAQFRNYYYTGTGLGFHFSIKLCKIRVSKTRPWTVFV